MIEFLIREGEDDFKPFMCKLPQLPSIKQTIFIEFEDDENNGTAFFGVHVVHVIPVIRNNIFKHYELTVLTI